MSILVNPFPILLIFIIFLSFSFELFGFFKHNLAQIKSSLHFSHSNPPYLDQIANLHGYLDISQVGCPNRIFKKIIRRGNLNKGCPREKDEVDIVWSMSDLNGKLLKKSSAGQPLFRLDAHPPEMMKGWEVGIPTMYEGEISSFLIHYDFAFGSNGFSPHVPQRCHLNCTLELLSIKPSILRSYKKAKYGDTSVKKELYDELSKGGSLLGQSVKDNKFVSQNRSKSEIKFFDPQKHQVSPNIRVEGKSHSYSWEEDISEMNIKFPLEDESISKQDIDIDVQPHQIRLSIQGRETPLTGKLFGRVIPSHTSWGLMEPDVVAGQRSKFLWISLGKSPLHRDIWSTVLDRQSIQQNLKSQNKSSGDTDPF